MKDHLLYPHGRLSPARLLLPLVLAVVLIPGIGARAATVPPQAWSAPSSAVDNITGSDDAGQVTTQSLCGAAAPGYASCAAQALVSKQDHHAPIHPRLEKPYSVVRTQVRRATPPDPPDLPDLPDVQASAPAAAAQADTEPAAAPLPQSGTPAFIQQAYDLTYLSETAGANATVGIVDAYDDPTAASDLATYRSEYGLPACTTSNGCLTVDAQTSATNPHGWGVEISLDLDAVSAVCPNCHIVLVETPSASTNDLEAGIQTAHELGATYISNSWGEDEGSLADSGFSFSGSTTFAAAGDSGYTGSPQYPAALPDVTAVGGTTLTYAPQTARGYIESAWDGTGSGCDTSQAKPSWQTGDNTGCTGRSYNDISADADPDTGLDVYDSGYDGWMVAGGTSLSSPMTAAYYALIDNLGATDAWPYQHTSALNDVTTGNNLQDTNCSSYPGICQAGAVFDGPTGNGTISGDVVSGAPGVGSNGYSAGVTGTTATVTASVYPNGASTQVYLEYGPSGQGYTAQTAAQSIGSGTAATQATFSLTGVAAGYHYRVVAANSYGTTYGYDVSLASAAGWPSVTSASIAATSATTAQASLSVDYSGSGSVQVVYGTTTAYGLTSASDAGSGTTSSNVALSGLEPGTTYHWAVVITNGTDTFTTPDGTFTTPAESTPAASAGGDLTSGSSGTGSSDSGNSGSSRRTPVSVSSGSNRSAKSGGAPTGKGLKIISVTGSSGRYRVRVTCTESVRCVGHVTLVQPLSDHGTRVIGTAAVELRAHSSTTVAVRATTKLPVTTAVAARASLTRGKRP